MTETFFIKGNVKKYPGIGGWFFVEVSGEISKELKKLSIFDVKKVGWGYIKVIAKVGSTSWSTTLFPQKNGPYLIAIKESVRKTEEIHEGDKVTISCMLDVH